MLEKQKAKSKTRRPVMDFLIDFHRIKARLACCYRLLKFVHQVLNTNLRVIRGELSDFYVFDSSRLKHVRFKSLA